MLNFLSNLSIKQQSLQYRWVVILCCFYSVRAKDINYPAFNSGAMYEMSIFIFEILSDAIFLKAWNRTCSRTARSLAPSIFQLWPSSSHSMMLPLSCLTMGMVRVISSDYSLHNTIVCMPTWLVGKSKQSL